MNWFKQLEAFDIRQSMNPLPDSACSLWFALMRIANRAKWPEWFTVANSMLQVAAGLSEKGVQRARNLLIQRGYIEYQKGRGNNSGRYKIIKLYRDDGDDGQIAGQNDGQIAGHYVQQIDQQFVQQSVQHQFAGHYDRQSVQQPVQQSVHQPVRQPVQQPVHLYRQDKDKTRQDEIYKHACEHAENACAYAREGPSEEDVAKVIQFAERAFGLVMNDLQRERLLSYLDDGVEADAICLAIEKAATANKDLRYALGIIERWWQKGIRTLAAAREEMRQFKLIAGGNRGGRTQEGSREDGAYADFDLNQLSL